MKRILGMKITRNRGDKLINLSHENYVEKIFKQFHMNKSKVSQYVCVHIRT